MLIYIRVRFSDIRFGVSSIVALLHDVLVVLAFYLWQGFREQYFCGMYAEHWWVIPSMLLSLSLTVFARIWQG